MASGLINELSIRSLISNSENVTFQVYFSVQWVVWRTCRGYLIPWISLPLSYYKEAWRVTRHFRLSSQGHVGRWPHIRPSKCCINVSKLESFLHSGRLSLQSAHILPRRSRQSENVRPAFVDPHRSTLWYHKLARGRSTEPWLP